MASEIEAFTGITVGKHQLDRLVLGFVKELNLGAVRGEVFIAELHQHGHDRAKISAELSEQVVVARRLVRRSPQR